MIAGVVLSMVGCASDAKRDPGSDRAPDRTGSIAARLTLPDGSEIETVSFVITGPGGYVRAGSVPVGDSTVLTFRIDALPVVAGYTLTLEAETGFGETCVGSAPFDILDDELTIVSVVLICSATDGLGDLLVNGEFASCPSITAVAALPAEVMLGGIISLHATLSHGDIPMQWSGPGGTFSDPNADQTDFTCEVVGVHEITVAVDGPAAGTDCSDEQSLQVTCSAREACGDEVVDPDEECDDGNSVDDDGCTNACRLPRCGDGIIQSGESCDDGSHNGEADHCDLNCVFVCDGNCPIYVDASAPAGGDGRSWATAFDVLQDGIDAAAATGGEVWVAAGTYTSVAAPEPIAVIPALETGSMEIYGGFAGTETTRDARDPETFATVLDGGGVTHHVVRGHGDYVLDGVTITGGNANGSGDDAYGGGMYNSDGAPTIRQCVFIDNVAAQRGGAIHNQGAANPTIRHCTFESNRAAGTVNPGPPGGGAISARLDASATAETRISISDSVFSDNYADSTGGAIWMEGFCDGGSSCRHRLELQRVAFDELNRTGVAFWGDGGVIRLIRTDLIGEDVDLRGVVGYGRGGCIDLDAGSSAELTNVRLSCGADTAPGAIDNAGSLVMYDCSIRGSRGVSGASAIENAVGATTRIYNTVFEDNGLSGFEPVIANAGTLELVHVTFKDNLDYPLCEMSCPAITGTGSASVVNSVFWPEVAPASATYTCTPNGATRSGAGNVALAASPFDGDTPFLRSDSPCKDAGSIGAAASIGLDWTSLTTEASGCLDGSSVDLGAHFPAPPSAMTCP